MARAVLVVEDEADLAGLLRDILTAAGYVAVLATATQAAERTREVAPAAVVMDYLMPGLNGVQVAEGIRQAVESPPPIILVTGLTNAEQLAREVGAVAYLRKPFDVDEFVRLINGIAARAP